jgi:hypothetical protein
MMNMKDTLPMANVINADGKFVPFAVYAYVPGKSELLVPAEHVLCDVNWRASTNSAGVVKSARPSVCVAIPTVEVMVEPALLADAVNGAIATLRKEIVSSYVNAEIAANTAVNVVSLIVPEDLVTASGISAYAAEKAASGKLTKDGINAWFDASMRRNFEIMLVEKFAAAMDDKKLAAVVGSYKDTLAKFAAPKVIMALGELEKLDRSIREHAQPNAITATLLAKIDRLRKPVDTDGGLFDIFADTAGI